MKNSGAFLHKGQREKQSCQEILRLGRVPTVVTAILYTRAKARAMIILRARFVSTCQGTLPGNYTWLVLGRLSSAGGET